MPYYPPGVSFAVKFGSLASTEPFSSRQVLADHQFSSLTTGYANLGVGLNTLLGVTTGNFNVAVGGAALVSLTTGTNNMGVGAGTLSSVSTGQYNCGIGYNAGAADTTGSFNLFIGALADLRTSTQRDSVTVIGVTATANASNAVSIGYAARGDHANSVALGASVTTTAANQVMVGPNDIEITSTTKGLVLKSPNGTRYRLQVSDLGVLSTVAA